MSRSSQQRGKDRWQGKFYLSKMCFALTGIYSDGILCLEKAWLYNPFHSNGIIKRVPELEDEMVNPPEMINESVFDQIFGSLLGLAIGDALGASVEFRPQRFLVENRVTDLQSGGTWGLNRGEVIAID